MAPIRYAYYYACATNKNILLIIITIPAKENWKSKKHANGRLELLLKLHLFFHFVVIKISLKRGNYIANLVIPKVSKSPFQRRISILAACR